MSLDGGVSDMKPGDVYQDAKGKRWKVVGYWTEPVVIMEPEEDWGGVEVSPQRRIGGVGGLMWAGFKKIVGGRQ